MAAIHNDEPFQNNGLAAISDLSTPLWCEIYARLAEVQAEFLSHESRFRSPQYRWPRDALHWWSRVWEYPYVFRNVKAWRARLPPDAMPHVVDFGSGVTFFPFSLARLGCRVTCTDIDPVCVTDIERAAAVVPCGPGKVAFRLAEPSRLPFADAEADGVVSVSVVEHVPEFPPTIEELSRILKPGGLLVLTIDLDLRGDLQLGVDERQRLIEALSRHFQPALPERTVHPRDILSSDKGPYAERGRRGLDKLAFLLNKRLWRRLRGRPTLPLAPFHLAVEGMAWIKRGG